ncbi:MAG TPA: signal peptidase I [Gammaproteobacteria bacterium]|nr:signal peptidase I [Gammaproteobacteria bacterium]
MNFPATLTALVVGCGIIALIDMLFFRRKRLSAKQKQSVIVENARSFFWVLLLVWVIRSFLIQPYRVPTGSLQPTVAPGDFLVVNQFAYGLRFPVGNTKIVPIAEPKRGDIVLFYAPPDPSIVFVKRLVGLPGDHIQYKDKVLYINGKAMPQQFVSEAVDDEPAGINPEEHIPVALKTENLMGVKHSIYVRPIDEGLTQDVDVVVPPGNYFMMGDNRDNSDDSRTWGFVPEQNLIGKAFGIWMSWDAINHRVRWNRIGKAVK